MQNVAGVFLSIGSFDNHVRSALPDRVSIGVLPPTAAAVFFSGQSKCALTLLTSRFGDVRWRQFHLSEKRDNHLSW
jgi:hypothetical protein